MVEGCMESHEKMSWVDEWVGSGQWVIGWVSGWWVDGSVDGQVDGGWMVDRALLKGTWRTMRT